MKETTDKNSTHLAGEYFVAAELYRLGYSLGMTIGNAKAIDIFVQKGNRRFAVQVKAIRNKKSSGWPMMKDKVDDDVIYVFVLLNEPGSKPDYFVATPKETRENVKQFKTRGIVCVSSLKSPAYQERWDKILVQTNT